MKHSFRFISLIVILFLVSFSVYAQNETSGDNKNTDEDIRDEALEMFDWKTFGEAQSLAKEEQKKVLVYVNARWCGYCKKMEREVFSLESVQEMTKKYFHPVWIDVDVEDEYLTFKNQKMSQSQFADALQAYSTPTFVFYDEKGNAIAAQPGYLPEDIYLTILEYVGDGVYLEKSFEEFSDIEQ